MSEAPGHGPGHADTSNKKIGLFIAVLALLLALAETGAKSAQTDGISLNVGASNLWAFYQAKTIRMTTLLTAAEALELSAAKDADAAVRQAAENRIAAWRKTAERYESEPDKQEGRKELSTRARTLEEERDTAFARYHSYELSSAAVQIAIVLASAAIITGLTALVWLAGGLGAIGLGLLALGFLLPHALHFH